MKKTLTAIFLSLMLLLTISGSKAEAQELYSQDLVLTQLRGSWQFHTFYDKWTLNFVTDHQVLVDREQDSYTLNDTVLRIKGDDGSTDYPFIIDGDRLTLTLPDGTERTYNRTDPGDGEQLLKGTFYASGDYSSSPEAFNFNGDHTFVHHTSQADTTGMYRVEGDIIVLIMNDDVIDEAQIQLRSGDNNSILYLAYHGLNFENDDAVSSSQQAAQSVVPSYDYVSPPAPIFVPEVSPPPVLMTGSTSAASISSPPASNSGSSGKSEEKKSRDSGSTREGKPGRR